MKIPSLWQRIRWYLQPPSLFVVFDTLTQPQIEFQYLLDRLQKGFAKSDWAKAKPSPKLIKLVTQQVADYDKKGWLMRLWWRLRGKYQDIAIKRSWLFYHFCQPFHIKSIAEKHPISSISAETLKAVADRPFLLSFWRRSLNNILQGMDYFNRWLEKSEEVGMVGRNARNKHPVSRKPIKMNHFNSLDYLFGFFRIDSGKTSSLKNVEECYQYIEECYKRTLNDLHILEYSLLDNAMSKRVDIYFEKMYEETIKLYSKLCLKSQSPLQFLKPCDFTNREYYAGYLQFETITTLVSNAKTSQIPITGLGCENNVKEEKGLNATSTAVIAHTLPNKSSSSSLIALKTFFHACGFFNLPFSEATPRQIKSAMRQLALTIHPDKTEQTYFTTSGEEKPYSTLAFNDYNEFRAEKFCQLQDIINRIDLPLDEKPYPMTFINDKEIHGWIEKGKVYRINFDLEVEIGKSIANLTTGVEELTKSRLQDIQQRINIEKGIAEINEGLTKINVKNNQMEKQLTETKNTLTETQNALAETNKEVKELRERFDRFFDSQSSSRSSEKAKEPGVMNPSTSTHTSTMFKCSSSNSL